MTAAGDAGPAAVERRWSGWIFHNPDTGTELSENHPIRSGECEDAENIRFATREVLRDELLSAWRALCEQENDLGAMLREGATDRDRLAAELAAAEAERDALALRVGELEADKARLDFLDRCNAALNAAYGTSYRWRLVLTHNVNRLVLGHGDVDLHDSDGSNTALPSCREAIDERVGERDRARAARTVGGSDAG